MSKSEAKRIDIQMKAKLKEQQQQIDALKVDNEELNSLVIDLHRLASYQKVLIHYPKNTFSQEYKAELEKAAKIYNSIMPLIPEQSLEEHDKAVHDAGYNKAIEDAKEFVILFMDALEVYEADDEIQEGCAQLFINIRQLKKDKEQSDAS